MTRAKEELTIAGALTTAKLTAFWLDNMSKIVAENQTGEDCFDKEVEKLLASAGVALLRWRLVTGDRVGLLEIAEVDDWENDEFD